MATYHALPPRRSLHSKPISIEEAQNLLSSYLEASKTEEHLHPDAILNTSGIHFSVQGGPMGGIILHNLRRVEAGLRGEHLEAESDEEIGRGKEEAEEWNHVETNEDATSPMDTDQQEETKPQLVGPLLDVPTGAGAKAGSELKTDKKEKKKKKKGKEEKSKEAQKEGGEIQTGSSTKDKKRKAEEADGALQDMPAQDNKMRKLLDPATNGSILSKEERRALKKAKKAKKEAKKKQKSEKKGTEK